MAKISSVAKAICCTPEPNSSVRKREDCVRWLCEALRMMRMLPSGRLDDLTLHQSAGIGDVLHRDLLEVQQRRVKQQPGEHFLVVHGLRDMVDGRKSRCIGAVVPGLLELDVPHPTKIALLIQEVEEASAHAAHRRDIELARADGLAEWLVQQQRCPFEGRRSILDLEPESAHSRPVRDVEGVGKSLLLGVDHEIDSALMPAGH